MGKGVCVNVLLSVLNLLPYAIIFSYEEEVLHVMCFARALTWLTDKSQVPVYDPFLSKNFLDAQVMTNIGAVCLITIAIWIVIELATQFTLYRHRCVAGISKLSLFLLPCSVQQLQQYRCQLISEITCTNLLAKSVNETCTKECTKKSSLWDRTKSYVMTSSFMQSEGRLCRMETWDILYCSCSNSGT